MNTVLISNNQNSLSISVRLVRLMVSVLSVIAVLTEVTLSGFWQSVLSLLAVYTFVTGVFGRDPLFALLRHTNREMPNYALNVVAQVECLTIGLICFMVGIMNSHAGSLIFILLPFLGIYPIVLCIVKHDLLGYLLQTYRNDLRVNRQD